MNDKKNPAELGAIVFISLPEGFTRQIGDFTIDPSILIPVELLEGQEELKSTDLTWEMIIAAMLKILVYVPDHEHAEYYRGFVLAAKPSIIEDLSRSGIAKAKSRDFEVAEELFKALISLALDSSGIMTLSI